MRQSRSNIGLSQSKLSALSKIVQSKISAFELGKADLSEQELSKLLFIIDNLDSKKVTIINKKRYQTVDDDVSVISSRVRRGYQVTDRNDEYVRSLQLLENEFAKENTSTPKPTALFFLQEVVGYAMA